MQRGTSYGIDAAYPDSLQPALLRVYRWVSCRWHEFLEKPQKLLEVADLDTPEPARQCGIGLKRCSYGAGDAPEPKRCRMSDVPKNNIARPMRASGFLASALFWEDRHDSTTEQEWLQEVWGRGNRRCMRGIGKCEGDGLPRRGLEVREGDSRDDCCAQETRRLFFPAKQTVCRIVAHVQRG
jgi:hypothetical protein